MTGKIKYKVVTQDRKSVIIPGTSKFSLTYKDGTIVTALPGTIGIMVFKNLFDANNFLGWISHSGIIIKVRPIGKAKLTPDHIAVTYRGALQTTQAIKAFNLSAQVHMLPCPQGTQCYNSVEVLE
jgi:hypothetical protein